MEDVERYPTPEDVVAETALGLGVENALLRDPLGLAYKLTILKNIDDPELKRVFGYTFAELRLGYLNNEETKLVQRLLSLALKDIKVGQHYLKDEAGLIPTAEFLMAEILGIIIPTRSRGGFERKLQATEIKEIRDNLVAMEREKKKGLLSFLLGR